MSLDMSAWDRDFGRLGDALLKSTMVLGQQMNIPPAAITPAVLAAAGKMLLMVLDEDSEWEHIPADVRLTYILDCQRAMRAFICKLEERKPS